MKQLGIIILSMIAVWLLYHLLTWNIQFQHDKYFRKYPNATEEDFRWDYWQGRH